MALQFFDASTTAPVGGLFFPVTSLPGISATELATGESSSKKHSKFLYSFLDQLHKEYPRTITGFVLTKVQPTVVNDSSVRIRFNAITHRVVNTSNNSINVIPVPTIGDNINIGGITLSEVFPGVSLVDATDAIDAGVLVPLTDLQSYGLQSPTPSDKELLIPMFDLIANDSNFAVRSQGVSSAIVTKVQGVSSLVPLPVGAYDDTNPTTGLDPVNLGSEYVLQKTYALTVELGISAETTEINYG